MTIEEVIKQLYELATIMPNGLQTEVKGYQNASDITISGSEADNTVYVEEA